MPSQGVPETRIYPAEQLHDFATRMFEHFGIPAADARRAADVLLAADLRAIDSHGVARLHSYFVMFQLGRISPGPRSRCCARPIRLPPSTPTTASAWWWGRRSTTCAWRR